MLEGGSGATRGGTWWNRGYKHWLVGLGITTVPSGHKTDSVVTSWTRTTVHVYTCTCRFLWGSSMHWRSASDRSVVESELLPGLAFLLLKSRTALNTYAVTHTSLALLGAVLLGVCPNEASAHTTSGGIS